MRWFLHVMALCGVWRTAVAVEDLGSKNHIASRGRGEGSRRCENDKSSETCHGTLRSDLRVSVVSERAARSALSNLASRRARTLARETKDGRSVNNRERHGVCRYGSSPEEVKSEEPAPCSSRGAVVVPRNSSRDQRTTDKASARRGSWGNYH